jgi:molecular chaperone GrpE
VTAAEDQPSAESRAAAGRSDGENDGQATERVVIRDRRKIDPKAEAKAKGSAEVKEKPIGGAHRAADPEDGAAVRAEEEPKQPALGAELEALRGELDERTHDLQRITAEYANYRKRVDRDRAAAAELTTGAVLTALLPVLDDIDRAREHGDLVGPFASVAESLTAVTGKLGLTAFGEKGDRFDPNRHEAVAHQTSADVTEPTCVEVMRRGYTLGERLLRPALVAVADPE